MNHPNPTHGRLVDPLENAFWDWTIDGRHVTTTSGKLSKAGRTHTKTYRNANEATDDLDNKMYKKLKEGFHYRQSENPGPIILQTWLTDRYTGFMSVDLD